MSNLNNPLRIFANKVSTGAIPHWLVEAYVNSNGLRPVSTREDAIKTIRYLDVGKKRERIIGGCVAFALWNAMWGFTLSMLTEEGRYQMAQDILEEPTLLAFVLFTVFMIIPYGIFFRDLFLQVQPRYYRYTDEFFRFVQELRRYIGDGPMDDSGLSDIPREWARDRADAEIVELAKALILESDIPEEGRIDWQSINTAGIELNKSFDYFKKLDLVTLDERGGYGWHFKQAKKLLAEG